MILMNNETNEAENETRELKGTINALWHYFERDFIEESTAQYEQKAISGLSNLDFALNGGFSPQLYSLIGRMGDERNAFLSFMAEHFATTGYTVLYFTNHDTENSLLQKIIARHDYKEHRDQAHHLPEIINKISSSPQTFQEYQTSLYPLLTNIHVETCNYVDSDLLVDMIKSCKKANQKVAVLIDEKVQLYNQRNIDRLLHQIHLRTINKIANEYEVPIFMNVTLAKGDFERVTEGFRTTIEIETNADNIILFSNYVSPYNNETLHSTLNPYVIKLLIRSNRSPYKTQITHLTYHPTHFYFQDA
ncbi:DnaB-like helicase C-terminal domain-containing protein [Robertmurraya siralis]|uniref:DnaB-like helicase C-terminal domain-containing protein n=1 Tax=Robertmurraya siralis TaxID=77777 RepID=UPI0010F78E5B|nr:DnaB-like helicase C-terminal domain-containing protein [Robertmurraya siralis]